jgi:hypothetical protein
MITVAKNKKTQLIGIVGFIGSGKDTVADYLQNFHEFRRESFASTLKDAVSSVFGWDRVMLEGRTKEAREWRETVDPWWAERLSMPTLTPRWILQYWGTEVCRIGFHDAIWIASLENKLRSSGDNIVVSDCRFPNEVSAIKNAGGKVIRVVRGPEPSWMRVGQSACNGDTSAVLQMKNIFKIHESEWAWLGTPFDKIIDNNGSIEDLYNQSKNLL